MSCVRKQAVFRIPAEAVGIYTETDYHQYEFRHPGVLDFEVDHLSYSLGNCGDRRYFDYVLYDSPVENGSMLDAYWEARPMTGRERQRYLPIFRRLSSMVDMRQAWYCEYIWYDGTDAPECRLDMYDEDGELLPKWRDEEHLN